MVVLTTLATTAALALVGTVTDISFRSLILPYFKALADAKNSNFTQEQYESLEKAYAISKNKRDKQALKMHMHSRGVSAYYGFKKRKKVKYEK